MRLYFYQCIETKQQVRTMLPTYMNVPLFQRLLFLHSNWPLALEHLPPKGELYIAWQFYIHDVRRSCDTTYTGKESKLLVNCTPSRSLFLNTIHTRNMLFQSTYQRRLGPNKPISTLNICIPSNNEFILSSVHMVALLLQYIHNHYLYLYE